MKVLISSCLLGKRVRYDGNHKKSEVVTDLLTKYGVEWIDFCPENFSLGTPRESSHLVGGDGEKVLLGEASVINNKGINVSREFLSGARETLRLCKDEGVELAILKEFSPSCGNKFTYMLNASDQIERVSGSGVTASLLKQNSIRVLSELDVEEIEQILVKWCRPMY